MPTDILIGDISHKQTLGFVNLSCNIVCGEFTIAFVRTGYLQSTWSRHWIKRDWVRYPGAACFMQLLICV
ncbi:hypothetical protein CYMTET_8745 [Cymbomonas tetramitiformis]|uniref:Uncharacterized protein n=1 Tax=Cymbomonas tetramitiformis TaxID=36881 RepID=A0AAE0LFP8_9CHLO|nr:hypothetical protein CYMTET_8745 [Cymbomonas tetramitiformis]